MAAERVAGHITAVCISEKTGMRKKNVGEGILIEGYGIEKDAHAKNRHVAFDDLAGAHIVDWPCQRRDESPTCQRENDMGWGVY